MAKMRVLYANFVKNTSGNGGPDYFMTMWEPHVDDGFGANGLLLTVAGTGFNESWQVPVDQVWYWQKCDEDLNPTCGQNLHVSVQAYFNEAFEPGSLSDPFPLSNELV